jgi:hypothetical protein
MLPVNPFNRGEQKKSSTIRNDSPGVPSLAATPPGEPPG